MASPPSSARAPRSARYPYMRTRLSSKRTCEERDWRIRRAVGWLVALGKHGTDTRATMMRRRRKGEGRRTQQRRNCGAEAAEKGERLFCPAVKTRKSSSTTRRTKKKEEAGGDGEQRRRWRACRSGEKRERYSEAFCERAAPYHAVPRRRHAEPCRATPCSVPSHAVVRSTAVAELSR